MKSGVGGDWTLMGVELVGDATKSPFVVTTSGVVPIFASFELFLLCAGGVGGRSMDPIILRLVCFSVLGLEFIVEDREGEVTSVSRLRPREGFVELSLLAGVEKSPLPFILGCGSCLCFLSVPWTLELIPFGGPSCAL